MTPPEPITVKVKTLTPIWTGDAQRQTTYLKATSFVGNMRFWAEALLRSLGMKVCDITAQKNRTDQESPCSYDPEKKDKKICSACEVFGCTGMARSFMLRLKDEKIRHEKVPTVWLNQREHNGKTPRYLDGKPGLAGSFTLNLVPIRSRNIPAVAAASLVLMLRWGSLGARDQYGLGFSKPEEIDQEIINQALEIPAMPPGSEEGKRDRANLKDFFFFKAAAPYRDHENPHQNIDTNPLPFVIRHDTRKFLKSKPNIDNKVRHFFCGNMRGGRIGTKYNIGLANETLYGWGWYPSNGRFSEYRDDCLNALKSELELHSEEKSLKWKEFASKRDNCKSAENWPKFLEELLTQTRDKLGEG